MKLKFFQIFSLTLILIIIFSLFSLPKIFQRYCPKVKEENLSEKAKPQATVKVGRTLEFLVDKFTEEKFKIKIIKAEKVKMVTSRNQPVYPKSNETFLLLYLEIENPKQSSITVDTQNYFRLMDGEKKIAPDFYNGQTQIPAIATKKDILGFIASENKKTFQFQVGEIDGKKEIIGFNF